MRTNINNSGFTLIELLVVLAVGGIILSVAVNVFISNQKSIKRMKSIDEMRANTRGAVFYLEDCIRMVGFDPLHELTPASIFLKAEQGVFEFRKKRENDIGHEDLVRIGLNREGDCGYSGCSKFDGVVHDSIGATSLVVNGEHAADDIVAISFSYAYDSNNDGLLELLNDNIIWAIDTDNDQYLDLALDSNGDGNIDTTDTPYSLTDKVSISDIRAVRVALLTRTKDPVGLNTRGFVLGVCEGGGGICEYIPPQENYMYNLLTTIVRCRNVGG